MEDRAIENRETPQERRARLTSSERRAEVEALAGRFYEWLKTTNFAVKPDLSMGSFFFRKKVYELAQFVDGATTYSLVMFRDGSWAVYGETALTSMLGQSPTRVHGITQFYGVFLDDMQERIARLTEQCPAVPWQG